MIEPDQLDQFRRAGRTLVSMGLVKEAEGNLSTFDGRTLLITRTGAPLGNLARHDVLRGSLESPPASSSSDLPVHVATYERRGPGALVHAHPEGTVPEEGGAPGEHGTWVFGASLGEAVSVTVAGARSR